MAADNGLGGVRAAGYDFGGSMIIQIQQTSLLVLGIAVLLIWLDQRHIDRIPYWYVATVLIPAFIAAAALIITTIIRIWS